MLTHHRVKAATLLAAGLALAPLCAEGADIYTSAAYAPAYVPANVWTGFYFGVNGGYGGSANGQVLSTSTNYLYYVDETPSLSAGTYNSTIGKISADGGFAGGQFGYNAQRGGLVLGFEVDAQGSGINGKTATSIDAGDLVDGLTINAGAKSELEWFGTLRGRLGYAAGPALFYVTGGFAVGGVRDTLSLSSTPDYGSFAFSNSETRAGYVIGGGLEYLISPSWSLKVEYQYLDLGSSQIKGNINVLGDGYLAIGELTTSKIDHTYNTVRAGLNYHINQPYEPLK
jgi:outer membrane immunogenic protein